ncbi:DUF3696 domain-containing protein [Carboxylicivirga sp. N1Y90]|uniref:DUF3696 domain-containing protein n=1 Tax=Carboxylicivirga fragile TaxID=3417571 RepID=UPI003D34ABBC|nr:DUF3696 domain-containing protein [Marinilabiliaceae bacterium N1Y90]
MINKIGIQNFRIFHELQCFNLDKINILTGTNGVGKSTFKNAFRLLKEVLVFDEKQHLVSLDNLTLSAEQKLILGSLNANMSYDSKTEGFFFSFCFKHDIYGDLTAKLQLDINENLQDKCQGTQLIFYTDNELLAHYALISDNHAEIGSWGLIYDSVENVVPQIHHALTTHKDLMHEQEYLCLLDKKLSENQLLSAKENELYERYQSMGYTFNAFDIDDEKHKINTSSYSEDEIKEQRSSTILLPNGNHFEPLDNRSPFLKKDYTNVQGLLFNSELLKLVSEENSLAILRKNSKYHVLSNELTKANVTTVEAFKTMYKEFEKDVLLILLETMTPSINTEAYPGSITPSFLELLSPCKKAPTAPDNKNVKNPIFRALLDTEELSWKRANNSALTSGLITAIQNVGKNKYNQTTPSSDKQANEDDFLFHSTLRYLSDNYKSIAVEFSKQLYKLLNNSIFAHSDLSFSNNYFLSDVNREKNPLLIFGAEFLNDLHYDSSDTIKFINKWLNEFEIAEKMVIKPITAGDEKIGVSYFLKVNKKERPLINFGRGINQFVCNLLSFCMNGANYAGHNTIFLEEPEVNLHPSFQSKLAEMVTDAVEKFNCSVVIETHSEYFIRKFQYLVASPKHKVKADDISISYLYHPDKIPAGKKQVEKLIIEEDGGLDGEFGKGFFDEASNWKRELMRLKHAQKN